MPKIYMSRSNREFPIKVRNNSMGNRVPEDEAWLRRRFQATEANNNICLDNDLFSDEHG